MASTMTTIALVLMGALTANASNLRLTDSNSPASLMKDPTEMSPFVMSFNEAGKNNNYSSKVRACNACHIKMRSSITGHIKSEITGHNDQNCFCMAYSIPWPATHKFFCAAYSGVKGKETEYVPTTETNLIAAKGGCKCEIGTDYVHAAGDKEYVDIDFGTDVSTTSCNVAIPVVVVPKYHDAHRRRATGPTNSR